MSKGDDTRQSILLRATQLASVGGLAGLSVGALADSMGMSKSGVFAHFRSKDALDLAVLEYARDRFVDAVLTPSFKAPRGLPRLEALLERWVDWSEAGWLPGGCPMIAAGFETDDQPGAVRDLVASAQRDLLATFAQAARIAIEEKHLRADVDVEQLAFELHGAVLAYHQATRLRRDPQARARLRRAIDRILDDARVETRRAGASSAPRR